MSITALPPGTTEPPEGVTEYYVCNVFEWAAATLKKGDACFFKKNGLPWKRGTYMSSYMYDGIIAQVYEDDPDDLIKYSLFLDLGDKLILPEDRGDLGDVGGGALVTQMRPSALKRFKDTYKGDDRVLPSMQRHVMRALAVEESTRRHDVMHPSEMAKKDWCGRHDYYRIIGTESEKDAALANPSFTMNNIFAEGHTIHGKYQDWLWEMGVLWGRWLCFSCDFNWNGTSPRECPECGSPRLMYREVPLNRELVGGHADGAVHDLDDWDGLIEVKSIGMGTLRMEAPRLHQRYLDGETLENIWWKIQRPFGTHLKQAQLYLWMAWPRYEEICFIYESKFHQQVKEFVVGYNPDMIAPILEIASEVTKAVAAGSPPARPDWAEDSDSKICKSCPYRRACWNLGAPDVTTQADDPAPATRTIRAKSDKRRRALRPA